MAPQRFTSVRNKPRPVVRLGWDDSGLIAVRYEQTKQAEPPIPLPPPRNPLRTVRRLSSTGAIVPITIIPPPVAPPQEEHPFFRSQSQQTSPAARTDEWKRDSGLARSASSATLREEYEDDIVYQKILDDIADAPSVYSGDEQSPTSDTPSSSPTFDLPDPTPAPLKVRAVSQPPSSPVSPLAPAESSPEHVSQPSPAPTRASSLTSRLGLGKSFSIRSAGKRKKSRSVDNFNFDKPTKEMDRVASEAEEATGASPSTSLQRPGSPPRAARPAKDHEGATRQSQATDADFTPITTSIPEESLWDDFTNLSFSKRGSLMFGGTSDPLNIFSMADPGYSATAPPVRQELTATSAPADTVPTALAGPDPTAAPEPASEAATTSPPPAATQSGTANKNSLSAPDADDAPSSLAPSVPSIRVVSMDVERESQKVRSLYESGESLDWHDGGRGSCCEHLQSTREVPSDEEENVVAAPSGNLSSEVQPPDGDPPAALPSPATTPRPVSSSSPQRDKAHERAGGLEDWENVDVGEVDRYGFITPRRPGSSISTRTADRPALLSPPRKRNVLTKRPGSAYASSPYGLRPSSRRVSARSLNTYTSEISQLSRRSTRSSIRSATNRLPHNRDRRWMDEAGDMLALQPGLSDIAEESRDSKAGEALRRKEAERTEKWRKMARVIKHGEENGHGMDFEFDTKNPKLIERTWKGIPDCWRGAAWHFFLAASANNWKSSETDDFLTAEFRRLQDVSSPDDVQIDLDVPRTINGHIMFRKRYRGGQRLLFRVLHAISLYFPETGYVQGMASLAATLLCYYDEERCFVMMVRLWRYRGLERLYQPGFAGLMSALADFEQRWLAGKDVADKLKELAIDPTAYGTRWYLTLFNLSIPFPAQLRVWDVFMLLGDSAPLEGTGGGGGGGGGGGEGEGGVGSGLDVLHATSAALMHALRDVLLDSDFENAMKALTAWIPVKDEDLLMKVAKAEWKVNAEKRRKENEKERERKGKERKKEKGREKEKEKEMS